MASTETKILDNIISSRRALLVGGGAAVAAMAMPGIASAASTVTTYADTDILNFALNLEYLEANFYYLAAFGTTIDKSNAASLAAKAAVIPITGSVGTNGTVTTSNTGAVPFVNPAVKSYAIETAIEEGKHVTFLRNAIGATLAVAQPNLNLAGGVGLPATAAFNALAMAAKFPTTTFDPFASGGNFLLAAYVFEDVGVTAYHGAAPLITQTATGKTYLQAAAGILAVEAYHAGLIRTTIRFLDPSGFFGPVGFGVTATQLISTLRANLAAPPVGPASSTYETYPDDIPLGGNTTGVSLAGGANVQITTLADADPKNFIAFTRTTTQVLNIVTGGGAATAGTKSTGVFFPNGMNGLFS